MVGSVVVGVVSPGGQPEGHPRGFSLGGSAWELSPRGHPGGQPGGQPRGFSLGI